MKNTLWICSIITICFGSTDYFQQHVKYDIDVTLNDSLHTLEAYEKIIYTNNSPDTLNFIWFHIWPNAYKNTETAFAKQRERFLNSSFIFSEEKKRGYIDSLDFKINDVSAVIIPHSEWIDVIKVLLPSPLFPGEKITIETPFYVKLPKVFSRLGHTGKHYEITQWYPKPAVYDNEGWHPMPYLDMGEFYSEFGSYDVKITLPEQYRIMATGDLVDGEAEQDWLDSLASAGDSLHSLEKKIFKKKIKKLIKRKKDKKGFIEKILYALKIRKNKSNQTKYNMKTLHYYQNNVHDFAWFADPNWIVRKGSLFLSDSTKEITLWSMYLPKNAEMWENSIEYLHDSGYWYSKFNGEYPYNHITAVDGDMSAGGGMEYPNITVISKMDSKHLLEMVIMHEVGHNWFYGILGNNERDHAWMDEGLNEFCNIRYWDKKYGKEGMRYVVNELIQDKLGPFSIGNKLRYGFFEYSGYTSWIKYGDEERLATSSNDFKRRANYWLSYSKTMVYTWHLLHYLGEETIDKIMHNYYDDWKFRHPSPKDFFSYVTKYTDKNMEWYTRDVFYRTGSVDYGVSIKGNEAVFKNYGTLILPFEVAFYDKERNEITRHWFEHINQTERFPLPHKTKSIIIDPDETFPDINRSNNATSKPLVFTWIFDNPQYYKREIFWMPWIFNINNYNGWTPGFYFYNGFVRGYDFGIGFRPLWDIKNERLIGSVKYMRNLYGWGNYYKSTFNIDIIRNAGHSGAHLAFKGKRKEHLNRYPVYTTTLNIDYHNIQKDAVDPNYYRYGEVSVGYAQLEIHNRPNPFLNYYLRTALKTGIQNSQFLMATIQTNIYYRFTKKIKTKLRFWIGGFIDSEDIPRQYRTYLSGSIDPDFHNNYIFDRTNGLNDFSIGIGQYDIGGPAIHGLVLDSDRMKSVDDWVISANLDSSLPKVPGKPFIDILMVAGEEIYIDCGLKKTFGPLLILLPFYQSWDDEPFIRNEQWIFDRMRVSLSVSNFNVLDFF